MSNWHEHAFSRNAKRPNIRDRPRRALARGLLVIGLMRQTAGLVTDMMTLARLHAALDSVVEARQLIAAIRDTSPTPRPALEHVGALFDEARELLRALLIPPEGRQAVGTPRS